MTSGLKGLLDWAKRQVVGYPGVEVTNFTSSWRDGLAFCAIIHKYRPDLIDFHSLRPENVLDNNELAFRVAEKELSIPALLDAEDMVRMRVPDRLSVATYVSQLHNHLYKLKPEGGPDVHSYSATRPEPTKRPLPENDENEEPELRRKSATPEKPEPAVRQSLGDLCAQCGNKVYILERHIIGTKLYHRVCYRRLSGQVKSPLKNYENAVLGSQPGRPSSPGTGAPSGPPTRPTPPSRPLSNKDTSKQPGQTSSVTRNGTVMNNDPANVVANDTQQQPVNNETKPKHSTGLPSWFKSSSSKSSKNRNSSGSADELPNNRLRLSDETESSRSAKLKENAVFNDLGVASSMNNTSSGELDTDSPDALHKQPVFPKVPNVDKHSPKSVKKKEKRFLDFRSMSNDSLLGKKNTNLLKKERASVDSGALSSARQRASAHWSTTSLDNTNVVLTSSRQSMASNLSTDSVKSSSNTTSTNPGNSESVQSFVPISALISTPTPYEPASEAQENEPPSDPNLQSTDDQTSDKTPVKPPIPIQPHFDPFDEVVATPERDEKISKAKSNTYVPDDNDKIADSKPSWRQEKSDSRTKVELNNDTATPMDIDKDGAIDTDKKGSDSSHAGAVAGSGFGAASVDRKNEIKTSFTLQNEKGMDSTDSLDKLVEHPETGSQDYPEELNPFAADDGDEREMSPPSGFVNKSPFKSATVRSIRTASGSPRRKRAAPTLPPGATPPSGGLVGATLPAGARISTRSEPGEVIRGRPVGDRASLPVQMAGETRTSLQPGGSPQRPSPASSPRREKRPAPKPPVATPRSSILNKDRNSPMTSSSTTPSTVKNDLTEPSKNTNRTRALSNDLHTSNTTPRPLSSQAKPNSLPMNSETGSLKRVKVIKEFDFTRASVETETADSPVGSETEELLNEIDLSVDSPDTPDRSLERVLSGESPVRRTPSKKPAPPKPVPPKRKINLCEKVPTFEIEKELIDIEQRIVDMEAQGRIMEDSIRLAEDVCGIDDESEMVRWFQLVNEKNALVRREQELTYVLREQDLEEDHEDIEHELRQIMAIQESLKTDADRAREAELLDRLLQIVNERNLIVHNIDDDRIRYEEEDRVIAATLAQSFSQHSLNDSPSCSPKSKKKEKKKDKEKKDKDKKKKGGIFSCVASRKTSSTFYPSERPIEKPKNESDNTDGEKGEQKVVSARKHGSTFYRDTDDVTI